MCLASRRVIDEYSLPSSLLRRPLGAALKRQEHESGRRRETKDGVKGAATEVQASQEDPWFKDASVGTKRGLQICRKTGEQHINRGLNK